MDAEINGVAAKITHEHAIFRTNTLKKHSNDL